MVHEDVDAFLRQASRSKELIALDTLIVEAIPGISRTLWRGKMWGGTDQAIVGYGLIRQPRPRGKEIEWFLVGLAEQKRHLSMYVNAAESGQYLVQRYGDSLGKVKIGAAAITFNALADVHHAELRSMLQRALELQPAQ